MSDMGDRREMGMGMWLGVGYGRGYGYGYNNGIWVLGGNDVGGGMDMVGGGGCVLVVGDKIE